MLILLSPAKKLRENHSVSECNISSIPIFNNKSLEIIQELKKYSISDIQELMKISPKLAEINKKRYKLWTENHNKKNSFPAIELFNGLVYNGLNIFPFNEKEKQIIQNRVAIISGLYGLLKPFDLIQPYRLEMGTKIKINNYKNLYDFWSETITEYINKKNPAFILNLLSNEYFNVINKKKLKPKIINTSFKDYSKTGKYKVIMAYVKKARGMMANYIIKNNISSLEDMKGFDYEGYKFMSMESNKNNFVFYRML